MKRVEASRYDIILIRIWGGSLQKMWLIITTRNTRVFHVLWRRQWRLNDQCWCSHLRDLVQNSLNIKSIQSKFQHPRKPRHLLIQHGGVQKKTKKKVVGIIYPKYINCVTSTAKTKKCHLVLSLRYSPYLLFQKYESSFYATASDANTVLSAIHYSRYSHIIRIVTGILLHANARIKHLLQHYMNKSSLVQS